MGLTYVPVIANTSPEMTVTQLNATDLSVSDTATINTLSVTGNATVGGNTTMTGTLTVNGNTTLAGVTVTSAASMGVVNASQVNVTSLNSTGKATITLGSATAAAYGSLVTGDTFDRFQGLANGNLSWGTGTAARDVTLSRTAAGQLSVTGNFVISGAGNGLKVAQGTNATIGTATLTLGSVTVNTTAVTANSVIMLTVQQIGTVSQPKAMTIANKTAGTSFQIVSEDATDTSTVAWWIIDLV